MAIVEQKVEQHIPPAVMIWLIALILLLISHFAKVDLGLIGIICWLIVISGTIYVILKFLILPFFSR